MTGSTTTTVWAGHVDPQTLPRQFADAYLGRFPSHSAYAHHQMAEQGWTDLLQTHGIQPYFDLRRHEQHLFSTEVTAIELDGWAPGRDIEVFRHRPS